MLAPGVSYRVFGKRITLRLQDQSQAAHSLPVDPGSEEGFGHLLERDSVDANSICFKPGVPNREPEMGSDLLGAGCLLPDSDEVGDGLLLAVE